MTGYHPPRSVVLIAGLLTAVGAVAVGVGAVTDRRQLFFSYFSAWFAVVTIAIGALGWLLIFYAMRADWPVVLRGAVEGVVATLPVLAVLAIPLAAGIRELYIWTTPNAIADTHQREIVLHKAKWLNPGFFLVRGAVYLLVFVIVGEALIALSSAPDAPSARARRERAETISYVTLPLVGILFTFASFDWVMSLTPTWYSTMFGVYVLGGSLLSSIAIITILVRAFERSGAVSGVNPSHYYALGRCLLTFVIFWAYIAFFQFLLIWIGNKPSEVTYFVPRIRGAFYGETTVLVVTHFAIPFLALLPYGIKRRGGQLAVIAWWVALVHLVDTHWLVAPAAHPDRVGLHWLDFGALLFVCGAATLFGLYRLRGRTLVPTHDPRLEASLEYDSA